MIIKKEGGLWVIKYKILFFEFTYNSYKTKKQAEKALKEFEEGQAYSMLDALNNRGKY